MKLSELAKGIAISLACIITTANAVPQLVKPAQAEAGWHWDWWNEYEDNALVVWRKMPYLECYKVTVVSDDCCRVWTNNDSSVPYWYPTDKLRTLIEREPGTEGYCYWDVRVDYLSDTRYFRKSSC